MKQLITSILFVYFLCSTTVWGSKQDTTALDYYYLSQKQGRESKFNDAIASMQKTLSLKRLHKDTTLSYASIFLSLGQLFEDVGQYNSAFQYYDSTEKIFTTKRKKKYYWLGVLYHSKGILYSKLKDYRTAEIYYRKALDIINANKEDKYFMRYKIYNSLAVVMAANGQNEKALHYYKKSIAYSGENQYCIAYQNLGNLYSRLGEMDSAGYYYNRAFYTYKKDKNKKLTLLGSLHKAIGLHYKRQGQYQKAKEEYFKVIELLHEEENRYHENIAWAYKYLGDISKIELQYEQALEYYNDGLENLKTALELNRVNIPKPLISLYKAKANLFLQRAIQKKQDKNLLDSSLNCYRQAIDNILMRRKHYNTDETKLDNMEDEKETFTTAAEVGLMLYENTGDGKYYEKAYKFIQLAKSGVLVEAMYEREIKKMTAVSPLLLDIESNLDQQRMIFEKKYKDEIKNPETDSGVLNFTRKRLFELQQKKAKLTLFIERYYPKYYNLKYKNIFATTSTIRQKIKDSDVVMDYFVSDTSIVSFIVTKDTLAYHRLSYDSITKEEVNYFISHTRKKFSTINGKPNYKRFLKASSSLYKKFIPKFLSSKHHNLIIVPDGILHYVPFDAMISKVDTSHHSDYVDYRNHRYLIHDYNVSYLPAIYFSYYENPYVDKASEKPLLAVAPNYKAVNMNANKRLLEEDSNIWEKYHSLPYALKEANFIASTFNADKLTGENAHEEKFKEKCGQYKVLHMAMHASIGTNNPMDSKMIFTKPGYTAKEDGVLYTTEVYALELAAEMIVLSACNTGYGKMLKGEGIMSLSRAFFYTGCPSIVMTYWPVEDKAGFQIMKDFYKQLARGYRKDAALKMAKINYFKNTRPQLADPHFWATYSLIGNPRIFKKEKEPFCKQYYIYLLIGLVLGGVFLIIFYNTKLHSKI